MKISLINLTVSTNEPNYGIVSLATYLRDKGGFSDINILDVNFDDLLKRIHEERPDVIGLSAMTIYYPKAVEVAQEIRKIYNPVIIIGGVHISTLPRSMNRVFDFGVIGEGEVTGLELLRYLDSKRSGKRVSLSKIEGILYWKGENLVINPQRAQIKDMDSLPLPDWSLVNPEYFRKRYHLNRKERVGLIMTSRGCPYRCLFCSTARFWQSLRFFSVKRVCDEIEVLYRKYDVTLIGPLDDMITVSVKRLDSICDELERRNILGGVSFLVTARVNTISEEMCRSLKRLNVTLLNFGFESGNDRVLKMLKKDDISIEQARSAVILCKKHRIKVSGSFIFGSPTETIHEMEDTVRFMRWLIKNGAVDLWSFVMTPFPGTPVWEIAKERKKVSDDMDFGLITLHADSHPLLLESSIPLEEFKRVYYEGKKIMRKLEFRYWAKRLMHTPIESVGYALKDPKKLMSFIFSKAYKRL